jgi:hypothetical protein
VGSGVGPGSDGSVVDLVVLPVSALIAAAPSPSCISDFRMRRISMIRSTGRLSDESARLTTSESSSSLASRFPPCRTLSW